MEDSVKDLDGDINPTTPEPRFSIGSKSSDNMDQNHFTISFQATGSKHLNPWMNIKSVMEEFLMLHVSEILNYREI